MRYTITLTISEQWTVVWNTEEPDGIGNNSAVASKCCTTQPALATSLLIAPELLAAMTRQAEQHDLSVAGYIQRWLEKKLLEFGSTPLI
ncbi:MAG: hypothetical protein NT075_08180 [Chloroflexi bacterium]|nr:hypothetical protein [Chloroflexota bacterium]